VAVTVEKVYQSLKDKYQLKLVAGEEGIYNMVQWISVIDNSDVIPYMRPTELAVTTGFAMKHEEELMEVCMKLQERPVCGFIINVGPYIPAISERVIEYCNRNKFPLFSLPWEIRLIDIINETDQLMIYSSHMKENVAEIFKDYIFLSELKPERLDEIERNGFSVKEHYQMILIDYKADIDRDTLEVPIENVRNDVEIRIYTHCERFIIISHYDQLIILMIQNNDYELRKIIGNIHEMLQKKYPACNIFMLVGPKDMEFRQIGRYYRELNTAVHLAMSTNRTLIYYEELDIYRLLLSLSSGAVLKEYYDEVLGNLKEYDKINHTDTIVWLKQLVRLNGNIQDMARENYVHRNTITYNLKKIEKITGLDMERWGDRLKMQICLLIHDLL
jgi:sugar diacid utilization regulator